MSDSPAAIQNVRDRIIEIAEELDGLYDDMRDPKCRNRRQIEFKIVTMQAEMTECRRRLGWQLSIPIDSEKTP